MIVTISRAGVAACALTVLLLLPLQTMATGSDAQPANASSAAAPTWIYPVIKGFGGVHPRPDAAVQPDPGTEYKVIADVVHGNKDRHKVLGSLERLARTVNVLGYAGVPASNVHIVAVLEGDASYAAASNAQYRKFFKTDNPNLALLHELKQAGVDLLVCGQALAELNLKDSDVGPDITVSLSALSDFVVYGQRGYSYMQL
ncbi:MAG: DsrE family protein [Rhodanobacter sp.]